MRVQREVERAQSTPNMTPFIDMLFILIIFFLATSRFHEEERDEKIQLVKTRSDTSLPIATPRSLLVVDIDKDGRKTINGREKTLEEIEAIIRKRLEEDEKAEFVVRSDLRARVGDLGSVTEICHRLGVKTPKISYQKVDD
ncbi:MAG: biopolymer transporter ExbD [Planctomycetota bacterium]|nr:biopolymer transporter ExbD [Planctomycetota bacterium]